MDVEDLTPEEQAELQAIRDRKAKIVAEHRRKKAAGNNHPLLPKRVDADRSSNTATMKVLQFSPSLKPHTSTESASFVLRCDSLESANSLRLMFLD